MSIVPLKVVHCDPPSRIQTQRKPGIIRLSFSTRYLSLSRCICVIGKIDIYIHQPPSARFTALHAELYAIFDNIWANINVIEPYLHCLSLSEPTCLNLYLMSSYILWSRKGASKVRRPAGQFQVKVLYHNLNNVLLIARHSSLDEKRIKVCRFVEFSDISGEIMSSRHTRNNSKYCVGCIRSQQYVGTWLPAAAVFLRN